MGRGTRREARKAGARLALRRLRETEGVSRKSPKRRERDVDATASARRARPTRDARQPSDAPGRHPILQRRQLGVHLLFLLCEDGGDDEMVSRKPRALTALIMNQLRA